MMSRPLRAIGCMVLCLLAAVFSLEANRSWAQGGGDSSAAPLAIPPETSPASEPSAPAVQETSARRPDLMANLAIFVLAIFVGFEVITKVPPTLHTPLMSGSNAISGITLVGALTIAGTGLWGLEPLVGFIAVVLATINVVGGFAVTHRMLAMFRRR